ncbi:MAG TPA: 30S ribosomal protein S20 [Candidatus Dependentiae bacterium]|nr:30S ribosomal protein S20 [Candidatus Dependentiae bacterium]HRQ62602.1 30S ribosomal protein S20 [Candidatus Dependentiae bacterium]
MPNIKSAKKRVKQTEKKSVRNLARKSAIKTATKKVLVALEEQDVAQAKELLKDVSAQLSRAKSKGLIHAGTAARKMSRLAKKVAQADRA